MSSLKDSFPIVEHAQFFMSVTPPVCHVDMWPYVASLWPEVSQSPMSWLKAEA